MCVLCSRKKERKEGIEFLAQRRKKKVKMEQKRIRGKGEEYENCRNCYLVSPLSKLRRVKMEHGCNAVEERGGNDM